MSKSKGGILSGDVTQVTVDRSKDVFLLNSYSNSPSGLAEKPIRAWLASNQNCCIDDFAPAFWQIRRCETSTSMSPK